MLSVLDESKGHDQDAISSGILWSSSTWTQDLYLRLMPWLLEYAKGHVALGHRGGESLAARILAGWGSTNADSNEQFITDIEFRDVLLNANEELRAQTLWLVERWSKDKEDGVDNQWGGKISIFLRDVWPRQTSIRTPKISARLCNLAFSNAERFPEIAQLVLPLLATIDCDHIQLPNLRNSKDSIIDLYPRQTLHILYEALPENVQAWPYDIEDILRRIGEADSTLISDEKLLELNRKWNSR